MGTIFVDNLEPQSGTSLTLGASGDTIGLASGASQTLAVNTPVLSVGLSSTQTISDNTWTTIIMNTEILDADGIYNNSTGVATPTAGTYFMIFSANIGGNTNNTLQNAGVKFLVGSTVTAEQTVNPADSKSRYVSITTSYVQTFDGSTTVACQAYNDVSSGTPEVYGGASPRFGATFQMIKLIGA